MRRISRPSGAQRPRQIGSGHAPKARFRHRRFRSREASHDISGICVAVGRDHASRVDPRLGRALCVVNALHLGRPMASPVRAVEVCGTVPLDVELIIDRSGSMQSETSGDPAQTRLAWAKLAVNQLVTALDTNLGIGGDDHRIGLTTFGGDSATTPLPLSADNDLTDVTTAINAITATGLTPLRIGMATGAADLTANARSNPGAPAAAASSSASSSSSATGRPSPTRDRTAGPQRRAMRTMACARARPRSTATSARPTSRSRSPLARAGWTTAPWSTSN